MTQPQGGETAVVDEWADRIEPALREKAYRQLDNDPQILLETDGGPVHIDADLIYARLIGFDDEIVEDRMRLHEAAPALFLPIARSLRAIVAPDPLDWAPATVAKYVLQSGFVVAPVDARWMPKDVNVRPDHTTLVAYLRYRRRA